MSEQTARKPFSIIITPIISAVVFSLAGYALYRELDSFELSDIVSAIRAVHTYQIGLAILCTTISYLLLSFYDLSGLKLLKKSLSYLKVLFESFCSYALSHNLGFPMFTGGAVRIRLLGNWGITASEITNIVAYNSLFLWLGFSFVLGLGVVAAPSLPFVSLQMALWLRPIAYLFLVVPIALPVAIHFFEWRSITIKGFSLLLPRGSSLAVGVTLAIVDWFVSAMVLYVLLPKPEAVNIWFFIKIFLVSQALGLISNVPGGVGVFEGSIIALLKTHFAAAPLLGSLLLYRAVYYVLPLFLASAMLGAYEVRQHRQTLLKAGRIIVRPVAALSPIFLTFQVAAAGILLIISGAVPPNEERFSLVADFFPLTAIEFSHFVSGLIGVVLLALAQGLFRRVSAAYHATVVLLFVAIILSVIKGFDVDEAVFLTIVLATVYPARDFFYRHSRLLDSIGEASWWALVFAVSGGLVGILFFSFKNIGYSHQLWWQLTADAHVSRALRATLGISVFSFGIGLYKLLSPSVQPKEEITTTDIDAVEKIIANSSSTNHFLSLLGDKHILFNEDKDGFVMYGVENRSVVSLGDPVAQENDIPDLVWSFYEMSKHLGGQCIFYEVKETYLWVYIEAGLSVLKLGEEAVVNLEEFKIEGKKRATLRHQRNRCIREGLTFEVIEASLVPGYLEQFAAISNRWLKDKNTREKGFSLGFFNDDYLRRFPAALVRRHGELIGFANILATQNKTDLSIDLMRYIPDAAPGTMDFLFTELMLWGKAQGFKTFNMGMAPFSGFEHRPFAPLWNRVAETLFRKGERFYNFRGLRNFKDKYDPEWSPRYLIYPGGMSLPFVLRDIASLISGGVKGVFAK